MALTDDNNMVMPVSPMYGNGGGLFGGMNGDFGGWLILFLIFGMFGNGWGNGFGGGFGGGELYPWMNQSNQINGGFRDQMINSGINGIRDAITTGFGDTALGIAGINQNLCQTGNGIVNAVTGAQNALAQQMYTNQLAELERSYAAQTASTQGMNALQSQLAQCCCDNRAATADLKYTFATEECATRNASSMNTRDIIDSQTRGTQAILDKLCALELDGVKSQLAQAQRENLGLQNQVNMATMQASQTAQTAQILAGQAAEIDGVYNRLKNCPVGTYPVCNPTAYQPNGCGCGIA